MKVFTFRDNIKGTNVVDIMIYPQINFEEAYENKKLVYFDDVAIPLVSLKHLLTMKKISGREKDQKDIMVL